MVRPIKVSIINTQFVLYIERFYICYFMNLCLFFPNWFTHWVCEDATPGDGIAINADLLARFPKVTTQQLSNVASVRQTAGEMNLPGNINTDADFPAEFLKAKWNELSHFWQILTIVNWDWLVPSATNGSGSGNSTGNANRRWKHKLL